MTDNPAAGAASETMSDILPEGSDAPPQPDGVAKRAAYTIGSAGILAATFSDALGVAGRHTGIPLLGSIELVQAAVVLLASTSILIVTLAGGHATVHMLTSRLDPVTAHRFHRIAACLSALAFLLIALGSAWVAAEMWSGHELTELLHIPIKWLRLLWIALCLMVVGAFLRSAWSNRP